MSDVKNNILVSSVATIVAELATLPICTIKTNYQNSEYSFGETIKKLYNTGGLRAFYRASMPAVSSQVLSSSAKYSLYRELGNYSDWRMLNGAISGVLSTLITHPVDFVKINWQMRKNVFSIIKAEGAIVLYRGYSKSFSKVIVGSSLFYPIYDTCIEYTSSPLVASFISAIVSTTIMQPVDYLKTRHIYGNSVWSWNPRQYFRGYFLTLARVVPHFMITMYCIYAFEKAFRI